MPRHATRQHDGYVSVNARDLLLALADGPVSGDRLARQFGQTRAAVWKRVEALRGAGLRIEATPGRGYVLAEAPDLLDGEAIRRHMACDVARLEVAWSTDSTNAALLREPPPVDGVHVLLAEQQTAGRGRHGRSWHSPLAANLYLSVSRRFSGGLARLGGLGLVAGVATAHALQSLGVDQVRLKWPNDLVVADRKLGGLLVEGSGQAAGSARAVVGLGLNVRMPAGHGEAIGQPWIDLAQVLPDLPERNGLAAVVLAHLLPAMDRFDREGLSPFLAAFEPLDALRGRDVFLHGTGAGAGVDGQALGLAEDGALRVRVEGGERRVHSGDVSVRLA